MRVDGIQANNSYTVQKSQSGNFGQGSQEQNLQVKPESTEKQKSALKEHQQATKEQINKTLEKANKSFQAFDRKFDISVHEATNTIMVKVIDSSNDEVIREIPPEKILDIIANMQELAGLLIDQRV